MRSTSVLLAGSALLALSPAAFAQDGGISPSQTAPGNGAANPGMDVGFGGQTPSTIAPEPNFVDSGMDAGYVDAGNAGAGNMAPDPGMDVAGNVDAGSAAPDSGGGGGGRKGHDNHD